MVDNILHAETRISYDQTRCFSEQDHSILPMVHSQLANSMADMIVEKLPVESTEHGRWDYPVPEYITYRITAAFVSESRYRELLQMERDLRELRRLVRG